MRRVKRVVYPILSLAARPLRDRIVAFAYARADSARGARRKLWNERAIVLRQKLYGRAPVIRRATHDGADLWVDVAQWEGGNLFFGRPYEPDEARIARSLIVPGSTVIDVGANVGVYTLLASRRVGSSGRVYAFEPATTTFELLRRNVAASGNVTAERLAVSERSGAATLLLNRESGLASLGRTGRGEITGTESVRSISLDEYTTEKRITNVSFLKVDVEGFEGHVLRGARGLLEREREVAVLAELAQENFGPLGLSPDDVRAEMRSLGFEAWPLGPNVFFARPGTPAAQRLAVVSGRGSGAP